MNMIARIFNFDTKNLIINNLFNNFKEKLVNLFTQFLLNFSKNKYTSFFLNLQKTFFEETKNMIVYLIESGDKAYRESEERKKNAYINIKYDSRTIYTIFGEITFNRTYYKCKNENKYYYFIDELLGLKKYDTYNPIIKAIAIDDSVNTNPNNSSYHSSLRILNILDSISSNIPQIPRQTIYRWLRKTNICQINYETINNSKILYVMADEKWIHEQDKNDKDSKNKWIMSKYLLSLLILNLKETEIF